ncbi:MAG: chromosomal replication initiator protein DnaA [Acidimicrobiia bacterium]|nr:chromosomal replication initiator protein DnaA [Acidimicrobiia bacterium]
MDIQQNGDATAETLWREAASALEAKVPAAAWNTWFQGLDAVGFEDGTLVLGVPSSVVRDRVNSGYMEELREAVRSCGHELDVQLVVRTAPGETTEPAVPDAVASEPTDVASGARAEPDGEQAPSWPAGSLNPRYRFDQFVIGTSNRFAHAAALSVAEAPARSYNPLFIYGGAGLGKTHLLHAIGHHVHDVFPDKRVRYVSTETFMNEFVDAIRTNTTPGFKRRYRDIDVLLIDDIQFLERSQQLQEEFFHTFNSLHGGESQIVICSDRSPKSIATLEDRLRSRFEWGLTTDIQPPEFETRLAILRTKAESEHFGDIPAPVLEFIANHVTNNVRELEGALIRVTAYSSLNQAPLTEAVAREVLSDLVPTSQPRVITPQLILEETAEMFGWPVEELIGKSRRRPLVTARQIGMYVFRELTDYSYPKIAEEFGGRDHTTVMHAVEKIRGQMAERRTIFNQVNELIRRIRLGTGG